jgi:hypothetical protein
VASAAAAKHGFRIERRQAGVAGWARKQEQRGGVDERFLHLV